MAAHAKNNRVRRDGFAVVVVAKSRREEALILLRSARVERDRDAQSGASEQRSQLFSRPGTELLSAED